MQERFIKLSQYFNFFSGVFSMAYYDVPWVSTPDPVVKRMLELAEVKPGELVYDLGAGDGRIVIAAVRDFKAKGVGVEIREDLVKTFKSKVHELNLEGKVKVIHGNFFNVNISDANVVTLYLLTSVNERIRPKLERELKPGVRVVSHDYEIPGWKPIKVEEFKEDIWRTHKIYLYRR